MAMRASPMKDGRTHLAHKAEHAVDLKTGAVLAVTLQKPIRGHHHGGRTLAQAGENVAELIRRRTGQKPQVHLKGIEEVVADKGYHSGAVVANLQGAEVRAYISEKKQPGQRHWEGKAQEQQAVYANRRRVKGAYGQGLLRKRGELIERNFAHCYDTGDETNASTRTPKHSQATADSRWGIQSESNFSLALGLGYSTGAEKSSVLVSLCAAFSVPSPFRGLESQKHLFHHHHSIGGKIIAISDTDFATQQNAIPPRTASQPTSRKRANHDRDAYAKDGL